MKKARLSAAFPARDRVVNEWEWAYALEYDVNRTGILADLLSFWMMV
ncbi:MAG: hypothetical protein R3B93_10815 [Bacteroidia bacterium]